MPSGKLLQEHYDICHEYLIYYPYTGELIWKLTEKSAYNYGPRNNYRYPNTTIPRTTCNPSHRIIWLMMTNKIPNVIDHIDRNGWNNKWNNLRDVTYSINNRNMKLSSRNTSGVKGVRRWDLWTWRADIYDTEGKMIQKYFSTKEEAVIWRKTMEHKYGYRS